LRNKTIEWIEKQKYTDLNLNQETKKNMKREREREFRMLQEKGSKRSMKKWNNRVRELRVVFETLEEGVAAALLRLLGLGRIHERATTPF
jgi:tRNA A37 methylthiotransferase MiaB